MPIADIRRNTFFAGAILTVCIVQLPQRFATVNGDTAFQAAVKLLPFGVSIPAGSVFAATIIGRVGVAPQTVCIVGGIFEVLGTILLS